MQKVQIKIEKSKIYWIEEVRGEPLMKSIAICPFVRLIFQVSRYSFLPPLLSLRKSHINFKERNNFYLYHLLQKIKFNKIWTTRFWILLKNKSNKCRQYTLITLTNFRKNMIVLNGKQCNWEENFRETYRPVQAWPQPGFFRGGGNIFGGRPRGAEPPDAREFSKIFKNFLKKIAKNVLFQHIFQKNLTNHALDFRAFGRNYKLLENFEKISKIQQKKLNFYNFWKNCY